MTHGTSAHGGSLSRHWADAGQDRASCGGWIDWRGIAGEAAPPQLLALSAIAGAALGLMLTTAWQAAGDAALYLGIVLAAGAAAALIALRPRERAMPAARKDGHAPEETSQLLAQMHHELRTPLNAVIGFSEVMLAELHGPLGNARYQEYAAHISESGGRLLKASEDALAVAATMTALLADRGALRRERLPVAALVQEAWEALAPGDGIRLSMEGCGAIEIECDWQATSRALQHLLDEAIIRATPGGAIGVSGNSAGSAQRIEIVARPEPAQGRRPTGSQSNPPDCSDGDCLRLMLARSLLEMQGATLSRRTLPQAEGWSACVAFPVASSKRTLRRRAAPPSAAARRLAAPVRRGDSPAGAAARASAGSHAAPPA